MNIMDEILIEWFVNKTKEIIDNVYIKNSIAFNKKIFISSHVNCYYKLFWNNLLS